MASLVAASQSGRVHGLGRASPLCKRRGRDLIRASASVGYGDYNILGVHPGASQKELKKAYRRLALKFHPDVCKDNECTAMFMQINTAYQRVIDENNEEVSGLDKDYDCWDDWEEWMGIASSNN